MRYVRKRIRERRTEAPVRRFEDGREVCLGNDAGRAEYQRRKQALWEEQRGECVHCHLRMRLDDTRMTHGSWTETGVLRDDRLYDKGKKVNELVHKHCLRPWHLAHAESMVSGG